VPKNTVEWGRSRVTIRRMRIECRIPKATDTHSEHITHISTATMIAGTPPHCHVIRGLAVLLHAHLAILLR